MFFFFFHIRLSHLRVASFFCSDCIYYTTHLCNSFKKLIEKKRSVSIYIYVHCTYIYIYTVRIFCFYSKHHIARITHMNGM